MSVRRTPRRWTSGLWKGVIRFYIFRKRTLWTQTSRKAGGVGDESASVHRVDKIA